MSRPIPDTDWIRAVLRHDPLTRHLHIDVLEDGGQVHLEGRVPTRADRERGGSVARRAATPGVVVVNDLFAENDAAGAAHLYAPRWQAMYRTSAAALAA